MSPDMNFRMTVQDVFSIRGRGTIVTGQIERGTISVGDEIQIQRQGNNTKVKVTGIEAFHKEIQQAQAGDNVGLLLADVGKSDVQRGELLIGFDPMFSWKS